MFRSGMLTSGGDCQALNAAMRGVVKGLCSKRNDVEIYGFQDGYKGLIYSNFEMLTAKDFSGILTMGGTILGTSRQPFKLMRVPGPDGIDKVDAIKSRTEAGKHFTIIAVAEGAITKEDAALPKKKLKEKQEKKGYPSVAYELAEKIQNRMDQEVRITVPGHTQRGGSPCPYDRVLATRLGAAAADLILKEDYGYMVGIKNGNIRKVPLGEVAGKLKMVDPKADIIKEAKIVGISFGDE